MFSNCSWWTCCLKWVDLFQQWSVGEAMNNMAHARCWYCDRTRFFPTTLMFPLLSFSLSSFAHLVPSVELCMAEETVRREGRRVTSLKELAWPGAIIPYSISDKFSKGCRNATVITLADPDSVGLDVCPCTAKCMNAEWKSVACLISSEWLLHGYVVVSWNCS